jgi:hypothetical protein
MDITEMGLAVSVLSVSIAVLRVSKSGKSNGHLTIIEADKRYKEVKVCDEIHKRTDASLNCIPVIKDTVARLETKVDILLNDKANHK